MVDPSAITVVEVPSNPLDVQITGGARMAYEVPPLPYDYAALEPHIDAQTMQIHHAKPHRAYVDKANAALEGPDFDGKPIEEVLKSLDALPSDKQKAVRNNGGGHYNHSLF